MKQGATTSGRKNTTSGSEYEYVFPVNNKKDDMKNNLVYFTTTADLPPTDPVDAIIQITMRREFLYEMWAYKDGEPYFVLPPIPKWYIITGQAKVRIMDIDSPKIVWDYTTPNNLFGITGTQLATKVGPKGLENPDYVKFTITDNNPWEAVETPAGIGLDEHIRNYAYNLGTTECNNYCSANTTLNKLYKSLNPTDTNIKKNIEDLKKSHQPTANLNKRYKIDV